MDNELSECKELRHAQVVAQLLFYTSSAHLCGPACKKFNQNGLTSTEVSAHKAPFCATLHVSSYETSCWKHPEKASSPGGS